MADLPKWDLDEAEGIMWIGLEAAYSMTEGMKKVFGFSYDRHICYGDSHGIFKWYTLTSELTEIGKKSIEKLKDPEFRKVIIKNIHGVRNKFTKNILEYRKKQPSEYSDDELFKFFSCFVSLYKESFSSSIFMEAFDFVMPDLLNDRLSRYNITSGETADLIAIPEISYLSIEEQHLIQLAMKQKEGTPIGADLKNHFLQYEWLATGHAGKKKIQKDYFLKRINELEGKELEKELEKLRKYPETISKRKKSVLQRYKLDKETLALLEIVDEISPLRDVRKENFVKGIFYAEDVMEEIAKRYGYTLPDLQCFEEKDILKLKAGKKISTDEIKRRKDAVLLNIHYSKGIWEIYSGKKAREYHEKECKEEHESIDEIYGIVASIGKACGKAKIIYGEKGFSKMNKGDILVTGMTRPEMLPVMKKAAAIVTDEGGVTCHAAIVARELGIPCIIGTRIGSKVINDDDIILVDADVGLVKKIKEYKNG
jgi:phosphohistidine swiveling domain-containing protein